MLDATDSLLFGLLVMLFGGFVQLSDTAFLASDGGLYVMLFALLIGFVGIRQSMGETVRE